MVEDLAARSGIALRVADEALAAELGIEHATILVDVA